MKYEALRLQNIHGGEIGESGNCYFNFRIFAGERLGIGTLDYQGKDFLLKLLIGEATQERGRIYFEENLLSLSGQMRFLASKIYVIETTTKLSTNLTVTDNIFLMRKFCKIYFVQKRKLNLQTQNLLNQLGLAINPSGLAGKLTALECFSLEMVRAVIGGAKIIFLNEVTNVLSQKEWKTFLQLISYYQKKNIAFVLLDHLSETLLTNTDRILLMKDGTIQRVFDNVGAFQWPSYESLKKYRISLDSGMYLKQAEREEVNLEQLQALDFTLASGECGVVSNLDNKKLEGLSQYFKEQINGKNLKTKMVLERLAGNTQLFADLSYRENLCFLAEQKISWFWWQKKLQKNILKEYSRILQTDLEKLTIQHLTDQQRLDLIYARIHLLKPEWLICIEPFLGYDMELRNHILQLLQLLQDRKIKILILTVNPESAMGIGDKRLFLQA